MTFVCVIKSYSCYVTPNEVEFLKLQKIEQVVYFVNEPLHRGFLCTEVYDVSVSFYKCSTLGTLIDSNFNVVTG